VSSLNISTVYDLMSNYLSAYYAVYTFPLAENEWGLQTSAINHTHQVDHPPLGIYSGW
jgi:hypothetical protein